ncbi:DNA primase [Elusimicrobiota bacterium]
MTIPAETIDQIRLGTDITELVREYVPTLKRAGRNWKANCPFHNEKTPSFVVSPEKGIYHCFGCNAGGDVFKFVMQIENISWPQSVKKLADKLGIVIQETREDIAIKSEKQKIYDLLEQTARYYHRHLTSAKEGKIARNYLQKRGISEDSIHRFLLGYAPYNSLITSAAKKGVSVDQLVAAGLVTKTNQGKYFEYMSNRLTFPIFDSQGRVIAFGGRTLKDDQPKYLNTPETSVYSKSNNLYGLYQAIPTLRKEKNVTVLEGYMDVLVTHQFGILNTVATLGTSLTTQHTYILKRYAENVTLLFDSDDAGNNAAKRAIETLVDSDLAVKVVNLPPKTDPDEYLLKEGKDSFINYFKKSEKSCVDFLTEHIASKVGSDSSEGKIKVIAEIIPILQKIKNPILKAEWIKYLSEKLNIKEDAIVGEIRRYNKKLLNPALEKTKPVVNNSAKTAVRSAEEEIIQILLFNPHLISKVSEDIFHQQRCTRAYNLIKKKIDSSNMINHVDDSDKAWFAEIMLEEKKYSDADQILSNLIRDINTKNLETLRKELEEEIILMRNGKIPLDNGKFEEYKNLTSRLKGSVK